MGWNGTGTFTRSNGTNSGIDTWQDDAASSTKILADRHDTHDQDLADGIQNCLTKDGQSKATAHILPATNSTYNLGSSLVQWDTVYATRLITGAGIVPKEYATLDAAKTDVANITIGDVLVLAGRVSYPIIAASC